MKHFSYLGLGSNIDANRHLELGLAELAHILTVIDISSVVKSEAIGFDGDPFLNLVVSVETSADLATLHMQLREIEFRYGRTENCTKFSSRTLDIDILTFDDLAGQHHGITLPRPETTENAFVLGPLSEIAPSYVLPGQTSSMAELWAQFDKAGQPLEIVRLADDAPRKIQL